MIAPREVLDAMMRGFIEKRCKVKSIEFYIVGGALPIDTLWGSSNCSFDKQKVFLSLADEYNVKAVRFNLVRGDVDDLTAIMTKDGLFWKREVDASSSSSFDSSESSDEISSTDSSSEDTDSTDETSSSVGTDTTNETSSSEETDSTDSSYENSSDEESINLYDESDSESSTQDEKSLKRKINQDTNSEHLLTEIKRKKLEHSSKAYI
jgi:hypothetical protein